MIRARRRALLFAVVGAACLVGGLVIGKPPSSQERPMVPNEVSIPVPSLHRLLVFAAPAYLSSSVEDTPYQWLKLCDERAGGCRTLLDVRGAGAVSMPADKALGLSPDGRYQLCLRMTGVDATAKRYRGQYFELYDLGAGQSLRFNTEAGVAATTDNIQGWSADHPHALALSSSFGKTVLAWPPGQN